MKQQDILKEELNILREDIIQRQKDNDQYVTGKTAAGFEVAVEEGHGWLGGYSYVGALERGRKPGATPEYFDQIILNWIKAKGLTPRDSETLERMAKSIAWVIHKNGSFLHRYGYEVDVFTTPINDFKERLANRLGDNFIDEITNQIF